MRIEKNLQTQSICTFRAGWCCPDCCVDGNFICRSVFSDCCSASPSYIGDMMAEEAPEELENFCLEPFEMKVQGLDRTLADKVFAICDYYMQGRVKKHSRHIYDIYKLLQIVPQTDGFKALIKEVRGVRAMTNICPSAQPDVNVPEMLKFLIENEVYKEDYENITARILEEDVSYDVAIEAVKKIAESGMFE